MSVNIMAFYCLMRYLFTVFPILAQFGFCHGWGGGGGGGGGGGSHVLVRSDTCGLLQKPMTSLMLVMSQHIVHYIFHEDFV